MHNLIPFQEHSDGISKYLLRISEEGLQEVDGRSGEETHSLPLLVDRSTEVSEKNGHLIKFMVLFVVLLARLRDLN
jgi:hypothetical protein